MPKGVYTRRKAVAPPNKGKGAAFAWLKARVGYEDDGCLPWPFCKDGAVGRGRIGYLGHHWWAHRLMCFLAHGEPPTPKHQAAHNCGNGHLGCVNPRHLEWKTNSENQLDRATHGRPTGQPYGNRTLLTVEQIATMRALKGKKTQYQIAEMFGVKRGTVEYWFRLDRGPRPVSTLSSNISRRKVGSRHAQ